MWHAQGKVTVTSAGTPVQVATPSSTVPRVPAQTIVFQQLQANTGKLWICDRANAVKATGVGILATIPAPTLTGGVATILPYASITIPTSPQALDLCKFWIDADNDGEGCQVSFVRQ